MPPDSSPTDPGPIRIDRASLVALWHEKRDWLLRFIQHRLDARLRRRIDEADILQEVFLEADQRLSPESTLPPVSHRPQLPLPLLLLLLAEQRVRQEHRRHLGTAARDLRREATPDRADDETHDWEEWEDQFAETPSRSLAREERKQLVFAALATLDPIDREILTLRDLEGHSNDSCAERLGISKSAASNRYRRAQHRIRPLLENHPAIFL